MCCPYIPRIPIEIAYACRICPREVLACPILSDTTLSSITIIHIFHYSLATLLPREHALDSFYTSSIHISESQFLKHILARPHRYLPLKPTINQTITTPSFGHSSARANHERERGNMRQKSARYVLIIYARVCCKTLTLRVT